MNKVLKVVLGWIAIVPLTFLFVVIGELIFPNDPTGAGSIALGGIFLIASMIWYGIVRIEYLIQNQKKAMAE